MKKIFFLLSLLPMMAAAQTVTSPDGNIALTFSIDEGRPTYAMNYKGKAVVLPSHLGLELAKDKHASKGMRETDLMDDFTIVDTQTSTFDETWRPVWGETETIRNHYNELCVTLQQQKNIVMPPPANPDVRGRGVETRVRKMIIRFRVYDDGIGLRYEFPQQDELNYFLI